MYKSGTEQSLQIESFLKLLSPSYFLQECRTRFDDGPKLKVLAVALASKGT
jgi:hypothetical protein